MNSLHRLLEATTPATLGIIWFTPDDFPTEDTPFFSEMNFILSGLLTEKNLPTKQGRNTHFLVHQQFARPFFVLLPQSQNQLSKQEVHQVKFFFESNFAKNPMPKEILFLGNNREGPDVDGGAELGKDFTLIPFPK